MGTEGYIKLHRRMMEWQWYSDTKTKIVFIHLLLSATHKETTYRKVTLKPGQVATSIRRISEETGLTIKQVRGALDNLKWSGEVASKRANKFSVITIEKWGMYQCGEQEEGKQNGEQMGKKTGNQRANAKNKNVKNINNIYIYTAVIDHLNETTGRDFKSTTTATKSKIDARLNEGFVLDDFIAVIDKKAAQWRDDPKMSKYLRPETLFGNKFEGYLNETEVSPRTSSQDVPDWEKELMEDANGKK